MGNVIVARHGATDYNVSPERIRGWHDMELSPEGKRDSDRMAARIATRFKIGHVVSSDLRRSAYTGQAIANAARAPISLTRALRPWDLGAMTGKPVKEVTEPMKRYIANPTAIVPDGESLVMFERRFIDALKQILEMADASPRDLALVTHTRNVRVLLGWLRGAMEKVDPFYLNQQADPLPPSGYLVLQKRAGRWASVPITKRVSLVDRFADARQGVPRRGVSRV